MVESETNSFLKQIAIHHKPICAFNVQRRFNTSYVNRNSKSRTRCESCETSTTYRHITCFIAAITHFLTTLSVELKWTFVGTIESNVSRNTFLNSKYKPKTKLKFSH